MKKILLSKLRNLFCGDDGAALVITLGVFFFMYIFCAGVYAIGFAVKEKIHLQNACDAAAYSAAVVQADTISRIATLNRAMGWTYAQMCKRQMDYIMYRWLEHTAAHYRDDEKEAEEWTDKSEDYTHQGRTHHGAYDISDITLISQGTRRGGYSPTALDSINSGLATWIKDKCSASMYKTSEYGIEGLEEQIYYDKLAIHEMNEAYDVYLDGLPSNIQNAVSAILCANIPDYMSGQCRYMIKQEQYPNQNLFEYMQNTLSDERTFVKWGDGGWLDEVQYVSWSSLLSNSPSRWGGGKKKWQNVDEDSLGKSYPGPFDKGSLDDVGWYVRTDNKNGIQRKYNGTLKAEWSWSSWYCKGCSESGIAKPVYAEGSCKHHKEWDTKYKTVDWRCDCYYDGNSRRNASSTYANSRHLWAKYGFKEKNHEYYCTGERAKPRKLSCNYFGPNGWYTGPGGTITVGLARKNTNPFYAVFRDAMETGFYSAFRPYNDWTWCFSSARAGYKLYELPEEETSDNVDNLGWEARYNGRPKAFNDDRDYCIDWKAPQSKRSPFVHIHTEKDHRENRWFYVYDDSGRLVYDENGWPMTYTKEVWIPADSWIYLATEGAVENYRRNHTDPDGWYIVKDGTWNVPMRHGEKPARKEYETYWRQSWNLTQSDWDAVLLPVRQGWSYASEENTHSHLEWMQSIRNRVKLYSYEPVWQKRNDSFLFDLVVGSRWKNLEGNVVSGDQFGDMFAGGDRDPDLNGVWSGNFITKTSAGWNGWWDIPRTAADRPEDQSERVQCRWNIGTPHGKLKWAEVTKFMFH